MENDWKKRLGVVYSTSKDFEYDTGQDAEEETLPPRKQKLYVSLDRKMRKGKTVTLVEGFTGSENDLKDLGKELKGICGAGGTAKDGEILVQGDFRERITDHLQKQGYGVKRKGS